MSSKGRGLPRPSFLEECGVVVHAGDLAQHHPAPDAAADGRLSVEENRAGLRPEEREDAVERRIGRRVVSRGFSHRRVPPDRGELFADPLRGEHEIGETGLDGGSRHLGEARARLLLSEGDSSLRLDVPQPQGSVRRRSRQDDGDAARPVCPREGLEEIVDRHVPAADAAVRRKFERAVVERQVPVRRNDEDRVRRQAHSVGDLVDRHRCGAPEDAGEHALVLGIEMLDHDERHARILGGGREEPGERLETSGGRSDPDDRQGDLSRNFPG
jgi:hypothetical protein